MHITDGKNGTICIIRSKKDKKFVILLYILIAVITSIHRAREIIQVVYVPGSQGHCGVEATMKRIAQDYSWRSIKADVRKYVRYNFILSQHVQVSATLSSHVTKKKKIRKIN